MIVLEFISIDEKNMKEQRRNMYFELFGDRTHEGAISKFNKAKGFASVTYNPVGYTSISGKLMPYESPKVFLENAIFPCSTTYGLFRLFLNQEVMVHEFRRFSYITKNMVSDFIQFLTQSHPEIQILYTAEPDEISEYQQLEKRIYQKLALTESIQDNEFYFDCSNNIQDDLLIKLDHKMQEIAPSDFFHLAFIDNPEEVNTHYLFVLNNQDIL